MRSAEEVRAELAVPAGTALLVTVARLAPQKGLDLLADVLALLVASRPDLRVRAVVAGDGPLAPEVTADADRRGLPLTLLGRRDDVPDLLAAADVVVVPSVWEGQPLIVQEALREGAAVVATDVGGVREVAGDAAALVRTGDSRALADAVVMVLESPARASELRARARTRAAALPTAADAVRQVSGVYRQLTAPRQDRSRSPGPPASC